MPNKTVDTAKLFEDDSSDSDSDSDNSSTTTEKKATSKPDSNASDAESEAEKTSPKKKKASTADGGDAAGSDHSKEDKSSAYDEEEEEQATEADRDFVEADEDDNAGIMEEYAKQDQKFVEDEHDEEFEEGKGTGGSASAQGGKTELDRQGALELLAVIVHKMHDVADKDEMSIRNQEPAFEKLQQHTDLLEGLSHSQLRDCLLDPEAKLLSAFARWLKPSSTGLAALAVRNAIYEFVDELDIDMERDLTYNDLGKVLMALRKHKLETVENQRKITAMIRKWTLKIQERLTRRRGESIRKPRKRKAESDTDMKQDGGEGSGDELETGVMKKRESSTRTSYLDQKLVEMGTDRIQRKQARLSKRTIAPERRTANQIMNQIRKARSKK